MTTFVGFPQGGHAFSADEVGQALAGLVVREANGVPRVGMLVVGPVVGAAGASWKVQVGPFVYVHQVAGAIQLSGVSAAEQVDILPAAGSVNAGQARIDVVCWDPVTAELVVVQGSPASNPAVPSVGALAPVAQVRVNAGDGMVVDARVKPAFTTTALVGSTEIPYTPTVSGYEAGFAPVMRAQYQRTGNTVEVEMQAETEREMVRVTGQIIVTTPFPIGSSPIAVEGGGYFLIGPAGAKRIYDLRVRQASSTQVVAELVRVDGRASELVPLSQGAFQASDVMSWRARFRYTIGQ